VEIAGHVVSDSGEHAANTPEGRPSDRLYRPVSVGDSVQLNTPKGLTTAKVQLISLGFTVLSDTEGHEIIVPNSVMMSSVVIRLEARSAKRLSAGA
jgi:Mechanosensitive ion channel, beta-domain